MAEQFDTMSCVKLGGFRSQLEVSCVSSHTEELWYYETVCLWITIYISKEGNPKAPFSIATTPRCWGGCYFFPWIAPLYPWFLPYNAECWARKHQVLFFWVFGMTRLRIEPLSHAPLVNTLLTRPCNKKICVCIYWMTKW